MNNKRRVAILVCLIMLFLSACSGSDEKENHDEQTENIENSITGTTEKETIIENEVNENCVGRELEYYITEKDTTLSSDRFDIKIPEGVYVPVTIVDDIDKILDTIEEITGYKYINEEHPEKIMITVEKTGTFAESGDAFGDSAGCIISPVELLVSLGEGYVLVHELVHVNHFRNGYTMNIAMVEGFATCITAKVIKTGIFPFYFDSVKNYSSDVDVKPENVEEQFASEGWDAYVFGWRFVSYIVDRFGVEAYFKLAQRDELQIYKGVDDYGDTEHTLPLVKDEFGDDILIEFVEWVNNPDNFETNREETRVDLTQFEYVNASAYFGKHNCIDPEMFFTYKNRIVIDYSTALKYVKEYKGLSCDSLIANVSARGKCEIIFYNSEGKMLEKKSLECESNVPVNVKDASVVEIIGDGEPVCICISDSDDNPKFDEMFTD